MNKTIEFAASPDAVWQTITDFSKYGEWNVTHVAFPDGAPTDVTAGATFKEKVKIMGMPGDVAWQVDEADAPTSLRLSGKGPMGTHMKYVYTLSPNGDGTQLDLESEFGGAALGAMAGALTKETDKALGESVEKLKALVA
ncbi:SRPBCC family protein [Paraconexibacter sp.]|uniref:type II toxin-antitoxin system Rv0910 family toxin n=1 Tax=Paraconexibacter sp. TaxID=2949640 RepID=UPI003569C2B1